MTNTTARTNRPASALLIDSLYEHLDLARRNAEIALGNFKACQQLDITGYPKDSALASYHEWTAGVKMLESVIGSAADAEAGR